MDQAFDNDQAITRASLYGTAAEPTYAGITSFMRRRYSRDLTSVDLAISGVPFDTATTNRPGSRFGPRAIRAASTPSTCSPASTTATAISTTARRRTPRR